MSIQRGAKVCSLIPLHSFGRKHIKIGNVVLHSLIYQSRFPDLSEFGRPIATSRAFRDENQTTLSLWFWILFSFERMKIDSFAMLRNENFEFPKKFANVIFTDGTAFSALFRRPQREAIPELKPWEVGSLSNDRIKYLDPGRGSLYTSKEARINDDGQEFIDIRSFTTKEYYVEAGFNEITVFIMFCLTIYRAKG